MTHRFQGQRALERGWEDFFGGPVIMNLPANTGDMGTIPGLEDPTGCGATKPVCHNY